MEILSKITDNLIKKKDISTTLLVAVSQNCSSIAQKQTIA